MPVEGGLYQSGATLGIALFPGVGIDRHTLIPHADLAMHRAEAFGRNTLLVSPKAIPQVRSV